jgi:hypothetical protein
MPSIWLCVGFGWLAPLLRSRFEVRSSTFDVQLPPPVGSKFSTARVRRVSGKTPVLGWGNCDETRIAPIGTEGSGPALAGRPYQASCKSVASVSGGGPVAVGCWSGGGPMWVAQASDSTPLTTLKLYPCMTLSAPCVDGATPAQARRVPHVDCASHWH